MEAANATPVIDKITNGLQQIKLNDVPDKYLFLPNNPFPDLLLSNASYIIYSPPINSSGDIYHMISYLMFAKYKKKELPFIQLSYDGPEKQENSESKMNTFSQGQRCIQFAQQLGFKNQFLLDQLDKKGVRQNTRRKKTLDHLQSKQQNKNAYYIEQKLLTLLISNYFIQYGRAEATKILNESYKKWSANENVNKEIKERVQKEIQKLPQSKSLIILQCRYSSKANNNQNLDEPNVFLQLEKYLKKKGFVTWYLFVDSRSNKPETIREIENQTDCFPCEIEGNDYGKLYHLEFLLRSFEIKNVKGIIGNTSGCLDLASFIGHNVLNLHKFKINIDYQSYRMFLQSSFLTVENFNETLIKTYLLNTTGPWNDFNDQILEELMPIAADWINGGKNTPVFPVDKIKSVNIDKVGFADLHQIITWDAGTLKGRHSYIMFCHFIYSYIL